MERKFNQAALDPLFEFLAANPTEEQVDVVAEEIKSLILGPPPLLKPEVKNLVKHIIRDRCVCRAELRPLLAKLLLRLKNIVIVRHTPERFEQFSVNTVIPEVTHALIDHREPVSDTLLQRLSLMNEMVRLNVLSANFFLRYAHCYASKSSSDLAVPFVYQILRNFDSLFAEGVIVDKKLFEVVNHYACYLAAIFRLSGPIVDRKLLEIADYLTARCRQNGHTHTADCGNIRDLPAHKPLKKTGVPEASLNSTVNLLRSLRENPNKFDSIASEICSNLLRASETTLKLHVEKLCETMSQEKLSMPVSYSRLLDRFQQPVIKSTIESSIKTWAHRTFSPSNLWAANRLWFNVELCSRGLLPSAFVITNVAGGVSFAGTRKRAAARLRFLHCVLASYDQLLEKVQSFDSITKKKLIEVTNLLVNALRKKQFRGFLPEISLFLESLQQRGGWYRQHYEPTKRTSNQASHSDIPGPSTSKLPSIPQTAPVAQSQAKSALNQTKQSRVVIEPSTSAVQVRNPPSQFRVLVGQDPTKSTKNQSFATTEPSTSTHVHNRPSQPQAEICQNRTKSIENHSIAIMEPSTSKQVHNPPSQPQAGPEVCQSRTEPPELSLERMKELLNFLDTNPNKADEVGGEIKSKLCASSSKSKFASSVSSLMDELLERSDLHKMLSGASVDILKILAKASVKIGEEPLFKFPMAVHDWAVKKFQCPFSDFEASKKLTDQFWFQTELGRLNLVPFRLYKVYITKTLLLKMTPASVYFLFRVLQEFDHIVDLKAWNFGEDESAFFTATSCFLNSLCSRSDLIEFAQTRSISNYLQLMEQKSWFRNIPISTRSQIDVAIPPFSGTPLPQLQNSESGMAMSAEEIDRSIDSLKPLLEMQPPSVFTEHVSDILDRMFGLINSDETLDFALKLCIRLAKVTSICGKSFISELQEHCLNWFSKEYRTDVERKFSNMQREVQTAISLQEKLILTENLEAAMRSYHGKTNECPRLVAKLFSSGCLAVSFVILFLRALGSAQNEPVCRKMLEMLIQVGAEVQRQAGLRNLGENFENIFEELASLLNEQTLSNEMKEIIEEIVLLKQNGWIVLLPEQRAVEKLNSMLIEVERDSQTFDCILAHLHGSPSEMCHSFYDILMDRLQGRAIVQQLQIEPVSDQAVVKQEEVEAPCEHCTCDSRKRPAVDDLARPSRQRPKLA